MMPTVSTINEMGFTTFRDSPSRSIPMTAVPEAPMAVGTTNNKSKDQIILMDGSFPKNFHLGDSTIAQIESIGVAKVLQSEKYAVEILDTMDVETPK
jgi:hypothetical protein